MDISNIEMWIVPGLLWTLGLAAWIMTYILVPVKAKKTGANVSGIPGVAFLLFLIAGLLSPCKWLALIGLADFSVIYLVIEIFKLILSGDLKYDWGKIYVGKMRHFQGYTDWDDSVIERFNEYYRECKGNKEYKEAARTHRFDFERYCRIVAGLRTSKYMGCTSPEAYSIGEIWGMSKWDYDTLCAILPEDARNLMTDRFDEDLAG